MFIAGFDSSTGKPLVHQREKSYDDSKIMKMISDLKDSDDKCMSSLREINLKLNFIIAELANEVEDLRMKVSLSSIQTLSIPDRQWNLNMVHAYGAWDMGYNGSGITIMIVDSGVDSTHPDISTNFNSKISLPINNWIPKYMSYSHGTSCASIAAGTGNKHVYGVAPGATIAAANSMGSGEIVPTSIVFATTYDTVDIYSNSWGVNINTIGIGITKRGYFKEDILSIRNGAINGRKGKGCIYIFAAGNEGVNNDNTSWQEILNTSYTIAVGAINIKGDISKYTTSGSCILISCPGGNDPYTSYSNPGCMAALPCIGNSKRYTNTFNGTSAAVPHASGICALILQVNPLLTWRDIQHILVFGSQYPFGNFDAIITGCNILYSTSYGYGIPNAELCCQIAQKWPLLPITFEERIIHKYNDPIPTDINGDNRLVKEIQISNKHDNIIIEHIIISLDIKSDHEYQKDIAYIGNGISHLDTRQTDISLFIESPSGTKYEVIKPINIRNVDSNVPVHVSPLHAPVPAAVALPSSAPLRSCPGRVHHAA